MRVSTACRLPTCLCSSPERERMKTSKSGQSDDVMRPSSSGGGAGAFFGGVRGSGLAHPAPLLVRAPPRFEALTVAGTLAFDDTLEFAPVDLADPIMLRSLVPTQLGIRDRELQKLRLRHGHVDEVLAQLVVAEALDLPAHRLRGMWRIRIAWPKHHDRRPPPPIERILCHRALCRRAARERHHDFEALALMKTLFAADAHHGARIWTVGAAADRDLIHDGGAIDEPADRADVRPGERRIVKYARVLRSAREQLPDKLIARDAECFRRAVEVHAVAAFVLYFGNEHRLAAQRWRTRDPVAFGQHTDNLGMGVLRDLSYERAPVGLGHPFLGLDLLVTLDSRLEARRERRLVGRCLQALLAERV